MTLQMTRMTPKCTLPGKICPIYFYLYPELQISVFFVVRLTVFELQAISVKEVSLTEWLQNYQESSSVNRK